MNILRRTVRFLIIPTSILFFYSAIAQSEEAPAACYQFELKNSIENTFPVQKHNETWCYQKLPNTKKVFVFNADDKKVTPELSFVVDDEGTITHGSLLAGEMTVHTVNGHQFNPFSVPMTEPKDKLPLVNFNSLANSGEQIANFLQLNALSASAETTQSFSLFDTQTISAKASILPWRGYWWPTRGMPILGPLSKYDRFVQGQTGVNPGTTAWDRANHAYRGVNWAGHCNGWTAAAILRSEPRIQKRDPVSGAVFSISDQKGILAEADYCVNASFFGNRNYGAGNNGDIVPALFHKTLLYYIGQLHKPVVMDYRSDSSVDNHIVSGYTMSMVSNGSNSYTVTASLSMHGYDHSITQITGVARPYRLVYKYTLVTDASGNPIRGRWLSANPDFMWAPLGTRNCQRMSNEMVQRILNL